MTEENSRRSFIKQLLSLGTGAAISGNIASAMSEKTSTPIVSNIEALGFQWKTLDPFLFCVHHEDFFPNGNAEYGPAPELLQGRHLGQDFLVKDGWRMYHGKRVPGFPGHPHRGFETVTVVRKGMVDHSDSMGASGRYGDGDVQWMTAGKGIQHAEMFPLLHSDKDNHLELFQIWLNLPAADKMVEPHFKMLWADEIPHLKVNDASGKSSLVEVIAGSYGSSNVPTPPPNSWAFEKDHEVAILNVKMEPGAVWELPAATAGVNRTMYFYEGHGLTVAGVEIPKYHMAQLRADASAVMQAGDAGASILILQGKPINEPVVQHGPFVMNSRQEIQQAFDDYQRTSFGGWPWDKYDPVHGPYEGRFAKHADGHVEKRS